MSEKTSNFNGVEISKKKFHAKQPIDLNLAGIHKIVIASREEHEDKNVKNFIDCLDVDFIRHLCIKLPQMSGFIKYFGNDGKNTSFKARNDSVLINYSEIWNEIKKLKGKKHT